MRITSTIVGLALFSLLGCSSKEDPGSEPFLNKKPDIPLCRADPGFQKLHIDGWEKDALSIDIRFLPRATSPCPGRRFPFVDVAAPPTVRWIQIVEVNEPIPGGKRDKPSWQLIPEDDPWIFADMEPARRDSGEPFINASTDGKFWDNPTWPDPPKPDHRDGARKWRSRSYAVVVQDKSARAVAAFTWGFTWTAGADGPEPNAPEPLAREAWVKDAERLKSAFPDWTFE